MASKSSRSSHLRVGACVQDHAYPSPIFYPGLGGPRFPLVARVVKLVNTLALEASALPWACGFESRRAQSLTSVTTNYGNPYYGATVLQYSRIRGLA